MPEFAGAFFCIPRDEQEASQFWDAQRPAAWQDWPVEYPLAFFSSPIVSPKADNRTRLRRAQNMPRLSCLLATTLPLFSNSNVREGRHPLGHVLPATPLFRFRRMFGEEAESCFHRRSAYGQPANPGRVSRSYSDCSAFYMFTFFLTRRWQIPALRAGRIPASIPSHVTCRMHAHRRSSPAMFRR